MVASDPQAPAPRVSDADRDQVLAALRDGAMLGRLSHETFVRRVDLALQARYPDELAGLLADLRPRSGRRWERLAVRAIARWSALTMGLRDAWRGPRVPSIVLPRDGRPAYLIGRGADCDLTLPDTTVSSHHAELRRAGNGWLLVDLGSLNGTRVNGWRVASEGSTVRPGDLVLFGRTLLRVSGGPRGSAPVPPGRAARTPSPLSGTRAAPSRSRRRWRT